MRPQRGAAPPHKGIGGRNRVDAQPARGGCFKIPLSVIFDRGGKTDKPVVLGNNSNIERDTRGCRSLCGLMSQLVIYGRR